MGQADADWVAQRQDGGTRLRPWLVCSQVHRGSARTLLTSSSISRRMSTWPGCKPWIRTEVVPSARVSMSPAAASSGSNLFQLRWPLAGD